MISTRYQGLYHKAWHLIQGRDFRHLFLPTGTGESLVGHSCRGFLRPLSGNEPSGQGAPGYRQILRTLPAMPVQSSLLAGTARMFSRKNHFICSLFYQTTVAVFCGSPPVSGFGRVIKKEPGKIKYLLYLDFGVNIAHGDGHRHICSAISREIPDNTEL